MKCTSKAVFSTTITAELIPVLLPLPWVELARLQQILKTAWNVTEVVHVAPLPIVWLEPEKKRA